MPRSNRERRRAYQRAYYRARQRGLWRRYRAAGGCGHCGTPIERFAACLRCRRRLAAWKRANRAARKQQRPMEIAA